MRISDWSSDVCSSDLAARRGNRARRAAGRDAPADAGATNGVVAGVLRARVAAPRCRGAGRHRPARPAVLRHRNHGRSEEHTSELQSLMRISYAVFCLKKKHIIHRLIITLSISTYT